MTAENSLLQEVLLAHTLERNIYTCCRAGLCLLFHCVSLFEVLQTFFNYHCLANEDLRLNPSFGSNETEGCDFAVSVFGVPMARHSVPHNLLNYVSQIFL